MNSRGLRTAFLALALAVPTFPALAADCGTGPDGFDAWLARFKKAAAAEGISQGTLNSALGGVSYSSKVISLDRNQHSFKLSFEKFYARRVSNAMINQGRNWIAANSSLVSRIEKQFGVPAAVVVSIWGLETNYGANSGNMPIFPSLATLSYDCRRSDFFRENLMDALRVVERGDMRPSQMRGAWAGEIGQTQFMAKAYYKYAVDFDGNGRRDLVNSDADVVASTANYLKGYGWQAGGSWKPGSHNWQVLHEWNKAEVYVKTIAVMAEKMASSQPLSGGGSKGNWSRPSSGGTSLDL